MLATTMHTPRVSGMNEYPLHVASFPGSLSLMHGEPGYQATLQSLDVSLKILSVLIYSLFVSCVYCSASRKQFHYLFEFMIMSILGGRALKKPCHKG